MSLNKIKMIKKTYDKTPCEEEKDCAHLAYFIEEQLQEIKRIKFNSIQIQDCPALLRDNDILVITLPTLFSNFHYITVVYEKKLIYIFQNYGSYEIPMLIKTVNFFNMVKDYLRILNRPQSDLDLLTLIKYESNMYGLNQDQIDDLLIKKEIRNARRQLKSSISDDEKDAIMYNLDSIKEWNEDHIMASFLSTSSSIFSWMTDYSYPIASKLKLNKDQEEYVMKKLLLLISDLYEMEENRNKFQIRQAKFFYSEMNPRDRRTCIIHQYQLPRLPKERQYKINLSRRLSYRKKK